MSDKFFENNQVTITGEIVSDFRYSHVIFEEEFYEELDEEFEEGFYMIDVYAANRLNPSDFHLEVEDCIPLMISERLIDTEQSYIGKLMHVTGQLRSHNSHEEKQNGLDLAVYVSKLEFVDEMPDNEKNNQIFLDGYICKEPIYSKTTLEKERTDLLIAVKRTDGESDYITCICWGRNARFASDFKIGGHVQIYGRMQGREYLNKVTENKTEKRIAVDVSVSKIEYLE